MACRGHPSLDDWRYRDNAYRDYRDLIPLETKEDIKDFLRAIQEPFVAKIDIEQSGLLDCLLARCAINYMDNESLIALHLPTPSERARRLLDILRGVSPLHFTERALPVLCEKAGFLIPARFWKTASYSRSRAWQGRQSEQGQTCGPDCTRCDIMRRVRLPHFADKLLKLKVIDFDTHSEVTRCYRTAPSEWCTIFHALENLPEPTVRLLQPELQAVLTNHCLRVPDDLGDLLTRGLPCLCTNVMDTMEKTRLRLMYQTLSTRCFSAVSNKDKTSSHRPHLQTLFDPISEETEQTDPKVTAPSQQGHRRSAAGAGIPGDGLHTGQATTSQMSCSQDSQGTAPAHVGRKEHAKPWSEPKCQQDPVKQRALMESGRTKHMSLCSRQDDHLLVSAIQTLGRQAGIRMADPLKSSGTHNEKSTLRSCCDDGNSALRSNGLNSAGRNNCMTLPAVGVDKNKLQQIQTVVYKGDFERQKFLHNGNPENQNTHIQNDEDLENQCQPLNVARGPTDELEAAQQSVEDLCQCVAASIRSVEDLQKIFRKVEIDNDQVRKSLWSLVQNYPEQEQLFTSICAITEKLGTGTGLQQELIDVRFLCNELLVFRRAFILSSICLETRQTETTEGLRSEAHHAISYLLFLTDLSVCDMRQKLHRLEQSQKDGDASGSLWDALQEKVLAFLDSC